MTGDADRVLRAAREAAPDVLAEALLVARERAVSRLADLLTDALVAEALALPAAGGSRPAPPRARPAEPAEPAGGDDAGLRLYAYALAGADLTPPEDTGTVGDRPLTLVRDGELALLVSAVADRELELDPEDLSEQGRLATLARRHDAVVRAAAAHGAVLPLRFGTVLADETAARELLHRHADAARDQLAIIGDAREWGLRLVRSLDAVGPPEAEVVQVPAEPVSGTAYLAGRRQALRERDRYERITAVAADRVAAAVEPHVVASVRRGGAAGSSLLLDVAYLVRPRDEEAFTAAVTRLGTELRDDGLALETTGPWPPYSFASLDTDDGHAP